MSIESLDNDAILGRIMAIEPELEAPEVPLAVVDLESHLDVDVGRATVEAIEAGTGLSATVFGIHDDMLGLLEAERIIVTGSADMLAEADWAEGIAQQVAIAVQSGIPTLAICFGHQMMARHYGGEIRSFDTVRKGIQPIMFHGGGPFAPGLSKLIHTHRDYVGAPGKMQAVAAGGFGGFAALKHPEWPLWTMQGHPEWGPRLCALDGAPEWDAYGAGELDATGYGILERFAGLTR